MHNILLHAGLNRYNVNAVNKLITTYASENSVLFVSSQEDGASLEKPKGQIYSKLNLTRHCFTEFPGFDHFPPVDNKLIKAIEPYQYIILKMMDGYFTPIIESFNERQTIMFDGVRLFNGLIVKNNIDVFITFGVPHMVHDYIMYVICKYYNIPIIMLYRTPVVGYVYKIDELDNHISQFRFHYKELISDNRYNSDADIELLPGWEEWYRKQVDSTDIPKPFYMKSKTLNDRMTSLIQNVKRLVNYNNKALIVRKYLSLSLEHERTRKFLRNISSSPDLTKKFFYYSLHYQPEGTTCPMAGLFVNQILSIEMLSYCLPQGYYIYVKEHPNQKVYGYKNRQYFERIKSLKNVVIVPTNFSNSLLLKHCLGIVTATGTIAFEAFFKGKPGILFGHYLANYAPNMYTVSSLDDCKKAVNTIITGVSNVTNIEKKLFLKCINDFIYPGEFSADDENVFLGYGISESISNSGIWTLLDKEVSKIGNQREKE